MPTSPLATKPPLEKERILLAIASGTPLDFADWRELAEETKRLVESGIIARERNSEIGERRHLFCEVLRLGIRGLICQINTEQSSPHVTELWFDHLFAEIGPHGSLERGSCKCGEKKREKMLEGLLVIAEMRNSRQAIARVNRALGREDQVRRACFTNRR